MGAGRMKPTAAGHQMFEVSSAFQKSVRRGLAEEAAIWGCELARSGFGQYAWKRMMIMVSEDIGLAEPDFPQRLLALYERWVRGEERGRRLFLVQATQLLARARKSRLVDHAVLTFYENPAKAAPVELREFFEVLERDEGVALGQAAALDLAGRAPEVFDNLARFVLLRRSEPYLFESVDALARLWVLQNKKKDTNHFPERLFYFHALLLARRTPAVEPADARQLRELVRAYELDRGRPLPDFAFDKHTLAGRRLGRGFEHFFREGALLVNEHPGIPDIYRDTCMAVCFAREQAVISKKGSES